LNLLIRLVQRVLPDRPLSAPRIAHDDFDLGADVDHPSVPPGNGCLNRPKINHFPHAAARCGFA
jgi:hypothetical protein